MKGYIGTKKKISVTCGDQIYNLTKLSISLSNINPCISNVFHNQSLLIAACRISDCPI